MECLRSFNFSAVTNTNLNSSSIKQWSIGSNNYWGAYATTVSTLNIQGFKNINIHEIEVIGNVFSYVYSGTGGVLVDDWNLDIYLEGTLPLIGNSVDSTINFFNINPSTTQNKIYPIGKFCNKIKFSSPIESVKFIRIQDTYAQGTGYETLGDINLFWNLNFVVHYKFEGE